MREQSESHRARISCIPQGGVVDCNLSQVKTAAVRRGRSESDNGVVCGRSWRAIDWCVCAAAGVESHRAQRRRAGGLAGRPPLKGPTGKYAFLCSQQDIGSVIHLLWTGNLKVSPYSCESDFRVSLPLGLAIGTGRIGRSWPARQPNRVARRIRHRCDTL